LELKMTTRGRSGCASVRIAALVVALLAAPIAFAESPLLPPSPKAPKIRVLLVMPAPSGKLSRRVALFDQALSGYQGRMSRARGLGDAEAIVEFTGYRRTIDANGVSHDLWDGQYQLVTSTARRARLPRAEPQAFSLAVIGHESRELEPAVDLLARMLARVSPPAPNDSI
jgi:hypothetical protein